MRNTIPKALALSLISASSMPSFAADFTLGEDIQGKFNATLTLGTQLRADDPNPDNYATTPSAFVPGVAPGKLSGQTGGSNLNFNKGDTISTVAKGAFDLDLKKGSMGLFVRANVWGDLALGHDAVPYGNYANQFRANEALSDKGFAPSAKFNNAEVREAYLYNQFDLGEGRTLDARLGRQTLQWGGAQMISGGINSAINAPDFASQFRPGALPTDSKLPLGMLSAKLSGTDWSLEGFLPYESRRAVLPGCGTFFDTASAFPQGCNMAAIVTPPLVPLSMASEAAQIGNGLYLHRADDVKASNSGQYGLAYGFKSSALDTDFKVYAMNTHASMLGVRMIVENIGGAVAAAIPQRLAHPNGLKYANVYAENNRLFGLSANKKLDAATTVYGEVAYRPNAPISMNAADLVAAFATRNPASFLARTKGILNVAPGGSFDGYDRFGVITANIGTSKVFPKALGAERVVVVGEVGLSHVNGLPDQSAMRYGRPLAYGTAANAPGAPCNDTVPGKTCTNDGFVTSNAWGLRLLMSASYPGAMFGATVTPSLLLARDVSGYSYDGAFSKGRTLVRPGLRFDWDKRYFVDVQYSSLSGGKYNLASDRSYLNLVAGMRF